MKHLSLVLISMCVVGHTLGFYVQENYPGSNVGSSCGCGKIQEYDHTVDSTPEESTDDTKYKFDFEVEQPKVSALQAEPKTYNYQVGTPVSESKQDDTKYKFNFEIEQPKSSDSETESKSYKYQIRQPQSESKSDDTKYKFDYTLQVPAEEKLAETPQRTLYARIDKDSRDKSECSCKQGNPCTCGYSSEDGQNSYSSRYVLPVRYENEDEYVVYPSSQEESEQYLRRIARDANEQTALAPLFNPEVVHKFFKSDQFRQAADNIRERFAQIYPGDILGSTQNNQNSESDQNEETVGSTQNEETVGSTQNEENVGSPINAFNAFAAPFVAEVAKLIEKFKKVKLPLRRRRDVSGDGQDFDKRIPMLRVKEYEPKPDNSQYSKYLSNSRVELKAPEKQAKDLKEMEKATLCHSCGSKLSDSFCRQCGKYQPQYVEYIEGKPVSYYPGATQAKSDETAKPRYIFDRYGHKYLENNGNLRLLAPQYQEAIVGDQPDFAGLANILNQNREIMQQLNPYPGRMFPEPLDFASETIDLIRDLARQSNNDYRQSKTEKRNTFAAENKQLENLESKYKLAEKMAEKKPPRSMYQVAPMRYDGKDGKLVVKVYAAKNDKYDSEANKFDKLSEKSMKSGVDMSDQSQMNVKKFTKNNKEYEVLTFDDYKSNDEEDIRKIIEHLHKKDTNYQNDNIKSN